MTRSSILWGLVSATLASLQAWDAGVLRSTTTVQVLVVAAILVPALALAAGDLRAQIATIVAAFFLLTVARLASPVPLAALHLAAFVPAVIVLFGRFRQLREARSAC